MRWRLQAGTGSPRARRPPVTLFSSPEPRLRHRNSGGGGKLPCRAGYLEEGLCPLLVLLRLGPGARALLGLLQPRVGILDPAPELALIELIGRHRLADQHGGVIGEHLQPALGLSPALDLAALHVQSKLRRAKPREHRHVVGEDADLADGGPGGELLHLAFEDLSLRGEDSHVDVVLGHRCRYCPAAAWASESSSGASPATVSAVVSSPTPPPFPPPPLPSASAFASCSEASASAAFSGSSARIFFDASITWSIVP